MKEIFAATIPPSPAPVQITQPAGVLSQIAPIISGAVQILLIIAGLAAFIMLLMGGFKWITSEGDKGKIEGARNQIIQALIGLIVVLAAWGLIILVESITGICLGFSCPVQFPTLYGPTPTPIP
jgi:hypothetical protein